MLPETVMFFKFHLKDAVLDSCWCGGGRMFHPNGINGTFLGRQICLKMGLEVIFMYP